MVVSSPLHVGGASAHLLRPWANSSSRPLIVAISGGIGSGKTTFARALAPFAAAYADADQLARDIVMPGTPGLMALVERFGSKILNEDGTLNRQQLAGLIFGDSALRDEVEQIMHPLIAQEARALLSTAPAEGMAVYDVPLIRNAEEATPFDVVIMVGAPLEEKLTRLVARGLSPDDAQQRIAAQIDDATRREYASVWVDNTGTQSDLEGLAEVVVKTWLLPTVM